MGGYDPDMDGDIDMPGMPDVDAGGGMQMGGAMMPPSGPQGGLSQMLSPGALAQLAQLVRQRQMMLQLQPQTGPR
jgi:hypothetical protein